jgi:undecaprenyl diphosphate synthase
MMASKINPEIKKLPKHIAIIMDGNGRWATRHKLSRIEGHREGAVSARRIIETLIDYKVPYLTLYVFSTENWDRPRNEIEGLFELLEANLEMGMEVAMDKGVKILHLGKMEGLPANIQDSVREAVEATRTNRNMTLFLAFNYGGRDEIVQGIKKIIASDLPPEKINAGTVSNNLYCPGIPDPDLIIRTGGEMRLSNFLLWQSAYSEIYFTPVLWPDFRKRQLDRALISYGKRRRRFGGLSEDEVKL